MLSPRSRGKGGRRFPGRDGGRGKRKVPAWRKQAGHAVVELPQVGELVELDYSVPFGYSAAEGIYLFDQRIARTGIHYEVALVSTGVHHRFAIRVPVADAERVQTIIRQIRGT